MKLLRHGPQMTRHNQYSGVDCLMRMIGISEPQQNPLLRFLVEICLSQNGCLICFSSLRNRAFLLMLFMHFVLDGRLILGLPRS